MSILFINKILSLRSFRNRNCGDLRSSPSLVSLKRNWSWIINWVIIVSRNWSWIINWVIRPRLWSSIILRNFPQPNPNTKSNLINSCIYHTIGWFNMITYIARTTLFAWLRSASKFSRHRSSRRQLYRYLGSSWCFSRYFQLQIPNHQSLIATSTKKS